MSDDAGEATGQQALLRLQECDTHIDQLLHRREHLPEHDQLADIAKRAGILRPELTEATSVRDEKRSAQAALEAEVDAIERRTAEINVRLYGTTPISPKDAQAMAAEVDHLKQRRDGLEDSELEIMDQLEPLDAEVQRLEGEAAKLGDEQRSVMAVVNATQAEIDNQLKAERARRDELAAPIASTLLAEYEKLRVSLRGVAVAALVGSSCGGCHLTLSASEMAEIKKAPAGTVIHCEECGRILVR